MGSSIGEFWAIDSASLEARNLKATQHNCLNEGIIRFRFSIISKIERVMPMTSGMIFFGAILSRLGHLNGRNNS